MRFVEKADLIFNECDRIGGTPVGTAVITSGGRLKARHVIHAVGPRMGEGNEDEKLRSATLSSLRVAENNGLHSIAFQPSARGSLASVGSLWPDHKWEQPWTFCKGPVD